MSTLNTVGQSVTLRLAPQVFKSLNRELLLINESTSMQFQDRTVSKEAIINAVFIDYLRLPIDERREILTSALRSLETLLIEPNASTEVVDFGRLQEPGLSPTKRRPRKKTE